MANFLPTIRIYKNEYFQSYVQIVIDALEIL